MRSISIIVPCYNVQDVLSRCLDSLVNQTIPINIIIVNDGSTDKTDIIAKGYAERFDNITVIDKANAGLPQARKTGLCYIKTEFVGFVDADDWVEPRMFETLYGSITSGKADIACCGFYHTYETKEEKTEKQKYSSGTVLNAEQAFEALFQRRDVFPYMWNKLFKTALFENIEFPTGNFTGEDFFLLIQLLEKSKRVSIVNEPLYHYWQSLSSMSRGGFKESHRIAYDRYLESFHCVIEVHPEMEREITAYLAVEFMSFIIAMSKNKNYDDGMRCDIIVFLRMHMGAILRSGVSFVYKCCAIVCAINAKIMTSIYSLLNREK